MASYSMPLPLDGETVDFLPPPQALPPTARAPRAPKSKAVTTGKAFTVAHWYHDLDDTDRYLARLADLPQHRREALLAVEAEKAKQDKASKTDASASKTLSLTKGKCAADPPHPTDGRAVPLLTSLRGFVIQGEALPLGLVHHYQKRDYLQHLAKNMLGQDFASVKPFTVVGRLNQAIIEAGKVVDSNFQPYREHNFSKCYSPMQDGQLLRDSKGRAFVQKYSCGEKYCLWCRQKPRNLMASRYFDTFKHLHETYGAHKVWRLQFTLPAHLSDRLYTEPSLIKDVRAGIHGVLRDAFGVGSRDNIALAVACHPAGDSDLFKHHFHFHATCSPVIMSKDAAPRYIDAKRLNRRLLQDRWLCHLQATFGDPTLTVNPPQISFHDFSAAEAIEKAQSKWQGMQRKERAKEVTKLRDKAVAELRHGLRYDLRTFGQDFEDAVIGRIGNLYVAKCKEIAIFEDSQTEDFAVRRDVLDRLYWRVMSIDDIAARWIEYCRFNDIETYGWLKNSSKWAKLGYLPLDLDAQEEPEEASSQETCKIKMVRGKEWDNKRKKMVRRRENWCITLDGRRMQIGNGPGMIPWARRNLIRERRIE